jgi:hypothetical protein
MRRRVAIASPGLPGRAAAPKALRRSIGAAVVAVTVVAVAVVVARRAGDDDDDDEDAEDAQLNYWRPRVEVVGEGIVTSAVVPIACTPRGGLCGPLAIAFDERQPPLLRAVPARGWRLAHWQSSLRTGPMPDSRFYVNGLGYEDTHQVETVTAVFVRD